MQAIKVNSVLLIRAKSNESGRPPFETKSVSENFIQLKSILISMFTSPANRIVCGATLSALVVVILPNFTVLSFVDSVNEMPAPLVKMSVTAKNGELVLYCSTCCLSITSSCGLLSSKFVQLNAYTSLAAFS